MRKITLALLAIAFGSFSSCATKEKEEVFSPAGPASNTGDMSWNRPTGPEGAGALGVLSER